MYVSLRVALMTPVFKKSWNIAMMLPLMMFQDFWKNSDVNPLGPRAL